MTIFAVGLFFLNIWAIIETRSYGPGGHRYGLGGGTITNVPPCFIFITRFRNNWTCVPDVHAWGIRLCTAGEYPGTLSYFSEMPGERINLSYGMEPPDATFNTFDPLATEVAHSCTTFTPLLTARP